MCYGSLISTGLARNKISGRERGVRGQDGWRLLLSDLCLSAGSPVVAHYPEEHHSALFTRQIVYHLYHLPSGSMTYCFTQTT